jgi:hypothetical protein
LYARSPELTIGYTTTDGITNGYTLFIEGVCVDPSLEQQYGSLSSRPGNQLPYVTTSDIVGKAQGTEVRISIRDTGTLLDARSCRDWWQANWNSGNNTCF